MLSDVAHTLVDSAKGSLDLLRIMGKMYETRMSFVLNLLKKTTYSELHRLCNELEGKLSVTLHCNTTVLRFDKAWGQLMTLILRKGSFS